MKPSPSLLLLLVTCSTLASCKEKDTQGSAEPEPTSPTAPDTLLTPEPPAKRTWHGDYILKGTELQRLDEDGKSETVLSYPGATYCETDNRSQAIWLLGDHGLSVYDLESQALELVVAAEPGSIEAFEVRFGLDQGKIGNADGLRDDVALIVVAAKRIALRSEIICEGAREALCYVDSSTDDPDLWELRPKAAAIKSRYDALKLADTPLLLALAERRLARAADEVEVDAESDSDPGEGGEDSEGSEGGVAAPEQLVVDGKRLCGTIRQLPATAPSASKQ